MDWDHSFVGKIEVENFPTPSLIDRYFSQIDYENFVLRKSLDHDQAFLWMS